MRPKLYFVALLSLVGLAVPAFLPQSCLACSCAQAPTPVGGWTRATLLAQSDVVFRGQVVFAGPLRDLGGGATDGTYQVTFQVAETWKGVQQGTVVVTAGNGGGDCTIPFQVGQDWLVYGHRDPSGIVNTGICSRTSQVPGGQYDGDLAVLGVGTLIHTADPPASTVHVPTMTATATEVTGTVDVQSHETDAIGAQAPTRDQHHDRRPIVLGLVAAGVILVLAVILTTLRRERANRRRS